MAEDLWHIHGLPVHLLQWMLKQPWCLGQSREGVVTIEWAMHPLQRIWQIDALPPVDRLEDVLNVKSYSFDVDHGDHSIRYCCK